jgi:pyrimidine-nucleoside phosphorylase
MLEQAHFVKDLKKGRQLLQKAIADGSALNKLKEMVGAQGGDVSYIEHPDKFPLSKHIVEIRSKDEGYVRRIEALEIGESAMRLGAGRETYDDIIDMSAGILLNKKVGDHVAIGDVLCVVHTNKEDYAHILEDIHSSFKLSKTKLEPLPIVHDYIR